MSVTVNGPAIGQPGLVSGAGVLGPYADATALQAAKPAASNPGATAYVGASAPYALYTSNGTAWSLAGASLGSGIASDGVGSLTITPTNGQPVITHVLASSGGLGGQLWKTDSREYPGTAGYSMQFREGTFSTPFTYEDMVFNFGYNWTGSARVDAAKPAIFFQFEHQYQLDNSALSSMTVTEWHLNSIDTNGAVRRPFNFVAAWDGGFLQAGVSGSLVTISDLAANNRLQGTYNTAYTTLSAGVNNSTTTIPVTSGANISNGHYITILAEGSNAIETVLVTAGGGTASLTVTRAQLGTSASAHASGATVETNGATLYAWSALGVFTDAASAFIVSNRAGTSNLLVVNRGGSTLASSVAVTAAVQNLIIATNTAASGSAALQLKANNGAKTASLTMDAAGSLVVSVQGQGGALYFQGGASGSIWRNDSFAQVMAIGNSGNTRHGTGSATATIHIRAGTATAGTAPLKFDSGTNLTTAENGAMEYNGTNLFFTRAGAVREGVITQSAVTTEALTSDTSVTVNIGGTTYKLLAKA